MSLFVALIVVADGLLLAGGSLWRVIVLCACLSVWLSMCLDLSVLWGLAPVGPRPPVAASKMGYECLPVGPKPPLAASKMGQECLPVGPSPPLAASKMGQEFFPVGPRPPLAASKMGQECLPVGPCGA